MVNKPNIIKRAAIKLADYLGTSGATTNAKGTPWPNGVNPTRPMNPSNNDPLVDLMRASGQGPDNVPLWQNWFIHKQNIGSTGTESYAGYPREEYLHELQGKDRAKVFDKMWRSDASVAMLISAIVNQISSAVWEIEPDPENKDQPEAIKRADLMRHIIFKKIAKEGGFPRFVDEALSAVRAGHAVFEKTYKLFVDDPKFGTFHGINDLSLVSAKTIHRFNLDPDGKLASVTQIAIGDLTRYVDIPSNFLMVLSINREGSNYEGISLLRPCYGSFLRKNLMLKLNVIGIEKFAVPTPVVDIPDGKQSTEQFANLIAALEVYTSGQANYLTKPSMFKMEFPKSSTYDPQLVDLAIESEDRRMAKAFIANFLEFGVKGSTSGKSQGIADLSEFFLCGIERIANMISEMVNKDLISELCLYNFGDTNYLPELKHSGITDKAGESLANSLNLLMSSGVLQADDELEANIRKRFQLPEKSKLGARDEPTTPGVFGVPKPIDKGAPPHPDGTHPTDPTKAAPRPPPVPPQPGAFAGHPGAPGSLPPAHPAPAKKTLSERVRERIRA